MVKNFIAPVGNLWVVAFLASLLSGIQLLIGQEIHANQVVKSSVACSVEKVTGRFEVSLELNCGGLKADTKDAQAIIHYIKSPKDSLVCTVKKDGDADCKFLK